MPDWVVAMAFNSAPLSAKPGEEIRVSAQDCLKAIATQHEATDTPVAESLVSLSQSEFATAVHQALRDFVRKEALLQNPLLRSHLVIERVGNNTRPAERVATLKALLQDVVESLQRSPREAKFYRAVYHTYLHPAASQEKAAEMLDVSIGTFRRHLKAGIARVTEILWHEEIHEVEN